MDTSDQQEQSREQLARFLQYLEYTPDNLNLLLDAIPVAMSLQDWEAVDTLLEKGMEHHKDSPHINAHAGFAHLRVNELDKAQECFQFAIDNELEEEAIIYNLAYVQFLKRDFDNALQTLNRIFPEKQYTVNNVILSARCKHNTDQLDEAITELKDYLGKNNNIDKAGEIKAEALLSLVYSDNGDDELAVTHANTALASDPTNFEALLARASSLAAQQNFDAALIDFEKANEASPNSGRVLSGLGEIAFHNFEFDKAQENLENAVKFMPDHIGTWHMLAWTYLMHNKLDEALDIFKQSYELDRSFGETHGGLAAVYAMKGDKDQAEKHMKLAKKLAPEGFSAIYAEMVLLNASGKEAEAKALFEKAKDTEFSQLGTTPRTLIDARLKQLSDKSNKQNIH